MVVYEDFVVNYEETAVGVLRHIGVEAPESSQASSGAWSARPTTSTALGARFSELKLNTDPDLATAEIL